jgi:dTDP-4-amino-4,6-dideoxygalactose transaminase
MAIPVFELKKQYKSIAPELRRALSRVFAKGMYTLGEEVVAFEKEFARFVGVPYAVGVGCGTDGLTLAVQALNLNPGDEVLLPANAYPSFFGIAKAGVRVRLVDCGEDGNIDAIDLARRIRKKTKAVVVVHLYGNPADVIGVKKVLRTLRRPDIKIIEDCAQSHGAVIGKKKTGTFSDIAVYSFYPSKNLGAYGDGGMVLTKSSSVAQRLRALRMYGEVKRYQSLEVSGVSRLDELQAAILRVKLRHLDDWNRKRRILASVYQKGLSGISGLSVIPYEPGACFHLFVIRAKQRDTLKLFLAKKGIGSAVHYPVPLHLVAALASCGYKHGDFPVSEQLSKEVLSLPLYPEMSQKDVRAVVDAVRKFYQGKRT